MHDGTLCGRRTPGASSDVPAPPSVPLERILVIEDELAMRTILADCLDRRGYRVIATDNGEDGLRRATEEQPDLILLDLMMPRLDGFAVCQELRRLRVQTPILVLTARGRVEDRVRGLDLGADDYLVKPFSRDELLARVRALLRRRSRSSPDAGILAFGDLRVDLSAHRVTRAEVEVELAPKEFEALRLLVQQPGRVVSRQEFLDLVWGCAAFPTTRTVDKHIAALRRKLESNPSEPGWIQTVHGVGYRWRIDGPS